MDGLEYEVLFDGANYHTFKYINEILESKIEEYDRSYECIESLSDNAKTILKDSQFYVEELEARYLLNVRQMECEHNEIIHLLKESNEKIEKIDSEFNELMSEPDFADRVKRYVVGKAKAQREGLKGPKFVCLAKLSPETVERFRGMTLEEIVNYSCILTLIHSLENNLDDVIE